MNIGDVEYLPPQQQARPVHRRQQLGLPASLLVPGLTSTPEDLKRAADQTDAFISGMSDAVSGFDWKKSHGVPKGSGKQFDAFRKQWSDFYSTDFSANWRVLAHTGSLTASLKNFQEQACTWATNLKGWGVPVPGILPACATSGKNIWMWIGIGAVSLVGLFILGKLVHTVAFGGAALEEAEEEALKIAEEKKRKKHDRTAYSIT